MSTTFFFNDTAATQIYTLSLHDALPITVPTQDMVFGAYYLTLRVEEGTGAGRAFRHLHELEAAFDAGDVELQVPITLRPAPGSSLAERLAAAGVTAQSPAEGNGSSTEGDAVEATAESNGTGDGI